LQRQEGRHCHNHGDRIGREATNSQSELTPVSLALTPVATYSRSRNYAAVRRYRHVQ
jgi:hypothetical protein